MLAQKVCGAIGKERFTDSPCSVLVEWLTVGTPLRLGSSSMDWVGSRECKSADGSKRTPVWFHPSYDRRTGTCLNSRRTLEKEDDEPVFHLLAFLESHITAKSASFPGQVLPEHMTRFIQATVATLHLRLILLAVRRPFWSQWDPLNKHRCRASWARKLEQIPQGLGD